MSGLFVHMLLYRFINKTSESHSSLHWTVSARTRYKQVIAGLKISQGYHLTTQRRRSLQRGWALGLQ